MVGYLFFGPTRPIYKKGPFGVFLVISNFLNMKRKNEFAYIGLIKQNDERPYLGMNPSFLRFVKNMRMDSSFDEL